MARNVYGKGKRRVIVPDSHHIFDDIVAEHGNGHKKGSPFGSSSSDSSHVTNLSTSLTQCDQHARRPGLRKKVKTISRVCKEQNSADEDFNVSNASQRDKSQSDRSDSLFRDRHDSLILCTPVKGKKARNILKDVTTKMAQKKNTRNAQVTKEQSKAKCVKNKGKAKGKENTMPTPENLPDFDAIEQEPLLIDVDIRSSTPKNPHGSPPQAAHVSRISDHEDFLEEFNSPPLSTNSGNVTFRDSKRRAKNNKPKVKKHTNNGTLDSDKLPSDIEFDRSDGTGDCQSSNDGSTDSDDGADLTASFFQLHVYSKNLKKKLECDSPISDSMECVSKSSYRSPNLFDHSNIVESEQSDLSESIEESVTDSDVEGKERRRGGNMHALQHEVIEEEEEEDDENSEEDTAEAEESEDDTDEEETNSNDKSELNTSTDDPEISKYQLIDHTMSFSEKLSNSSICDVPITAEERVLSLCEQTEPISFTDCISQRVMSKCIKIGEGVYGEVFRTCIHGETVALKIIPIEGDAIVNDCPQKKFEEILPEIVIAKISCVRGEFPAPLLEQWDIFSKNKVSENDRPDMFSSDQLFIVFEFVDGGRALENFKFSNHREAFSILRQVVFALAVAEKELEFEHRDLHIGNVLVRSSKQVTVSFTLENEEFEFPSEGVIATIIDFTISRLKKDGCAVFCDVSTDEGLFEGTGDFQFDVYRDMRKENENDWQLFCPHSNVLWINYLCKKLMSFTNYKEYGRGYRDIQRHMRSLIDSMLDKESCMHLARDLSCW